MSCWIEWPENVPKKKLLNVVLQKIGEDEMVTEKEVLERGVGGER